MYMQTISQQNVSPSIIVGVNENIRVITSTLWLNASEHPLTLYRLSAPIENLKITLIRKENEVFSLSDFAVDGKKRRRSHTLIFIFLFLLHRSFSDLCVMQKAS